MFLLKKEVSRVLNILLMFCDLGVLGEGEGRGSLFLALSQAPPSQTGAWENTTVKGNFKQQLPISALKYMLKSYFPLRA